MLPDSAKSPADWSRVSGAGQGGPPLAGCNEANLTQYNSKTAAPHRLQTVEGDNPYWGEPQSRAQCSLVSSDQL